MREERLQFSETEQGADLGWVVVVVVVVWGDFSDS